MEVVMKLCTKCKIEKDESEFYNVTPTTLRSQCKMCRLAHVRDYKKANPERAKASTKRYRIKNRDKIQAAQADYMKKYRYRITAHETKRYREDVLFALKKRVKHRIRQVLRKAFGVSKSKSTNKILGCTSTELLTHLGISSIDELAGNQIDHVCPLSCAKTEEEVYKLNHYSNLRILPAAENLAKSDSWTEAGAMLHLILLGREWIKPSQNNS
jgi:hypothetical protein